MSWGSSTKLLWRAQPPSHFLVRAGSLAVAAVLSLTPSSDSNSCYYMIVKERGDEKKRRENRECGEGGIDHKHSNKMKANGKKEARHNTMVKETLLSIPPLQARKNEDQGQPFGLYTRTF